MPKYVSYDEMVEILDNKYLLPFRKDERLRGLNGIDIVRCKECKYRYVTGEAAHLGLADGFYVCDFMDAQYEDEGYCHHGERNEKIQGLEYAENILDNILGEQEEGEE